MTPHVALSGKLSKDQENSMALQYVIIELENGDLYIGWLHQMASQFATFILDVDRTYHTSGLDSVVLWNHVIKEIIPC
jgi:hypothetical protein